MSLESEFLRFSADNLLESVARIETCAGQLTADQLWARGSENENAAGNLILHLDGNVRQWILHAVDRQPDVRQRDSEFAATGGQNAADMLASLRATVEEAARVIRGLLAARLLDGITVQKYDVTVLEAIYHVVEHFTGHTYQIILLTKMFTGGDLGFYAHLNAKRAAAPLP